MTEKAKLRKDTAVLLDEYFNTPSTSLLIFHFEPHSCSSSESRLKKSAISHTAIDGKDLYILDDFFLPSEGKEMRDFSRTTSFSKYSYGSTETIEKGQQPAFSMNGKERWQFFSNPPSAIQELYKLLGMFAAKLHVNVTTFPWELVGRAAYGSPAMFINKLVRFSKESMESGKHQDYKPENHTLFGIPVLYSGENRLHPDHFINGAIGRPWLVSAMVYITDEEFLPEYRMGTVFYQKNGAIAQRVDCRNMRIVFFEGDIFHAIEDSSIPDAIKTWRVSYVFRMVMNPREKDQNIKKCFSEYISNLCTTKAVLN
jgi:hypothetical protein